MTKHISATFVQDVPQPGRSWHVTTDELTTLCGMEITKGRFEFFTTSTMPEWKVCEACGRKVR